MTNNKEIVGNSYRVLSVVIAVVSVSGWILVGVGILLLADAIASGAKVYAEMAEFGGFAPAFGFFAIGIPLSIILSGVFSLLTAHVARAVRNNTLMTAEMLLIARRHEMKEFGNNDRVLAMSAQSGTSRTRNAREHAKVEPPRMSRAIPADEGENL